MKCIPKGKISRSFLVILMALYGIGLWNAPSPILDRSPYSDPIWAKLTILPLVIGLFETGLFLVTSPGKVEDYVDRKGWFLTQEEFYFLNEYNEKIWLLDENEKNLAINLDRFRKSNKKQEYLKNFTNFDWDEACYFAPYDYWLIETGEKFFSENYKLNKKIPKYIDNSEKSMIFLNKENKSAVVMIFSSLSKAFVTSSIYECKNKDDLIVKINKSQSFELIVK